MNHRSLCVFIFSLSTTPLAVVQLPPCPTSLFLLSPLHGAPPRRGGCAPTRTWRCTTGAGSSAWFPWLVRETSTSPSSADQRGGSPRARTRGAIQTSRVGRFHSLGSDGLFHLKRITCRCHFFYTLHMFFALSSYVSTG